MPCANQRFSMFTHPCLGVHIRVLRPSAGRRARAGGAPSSCPSSTSFFTHFDTAGRAGSKRRRSRRGLCAPTSLSLGPPLVLWRTAFPVPSLFSSSHPPIPPFGCCVFFLESRSRSLVCSRTANWAPHSVSQLTKPTNGVKPAQ